MRTRQRLLPALLVLLGAAGAIALYRGRSSTIVNSEGAATTPAQLPRTVHVSIVAAPEEATIRLDGQTVAQNLYAATVPSSPRTVPVEVDAPGYGHFAQNVRLDADVTLSVHLPKLEKPEPASSVAVSAAPPHRAAAPVFRAAAQSASSAPNAAKANCNPPYSISASGLKTYKPECI